MTAMAGFSATDPRNWDIDLLKEQPAYLAGNTLGWLYRGNKQAATSYPLSGRLYLSKSGWLLLSVPNALVRGVFDALSAPGTELPLAGVMNVPDVQPELLNAHISVMTADEVSKIGAHKITERGHMYGYTLAGLNELDVKNVDGVSKVWALKVLSPGLAALRKSYGLSPKLHDQHDFHITIAVRRKRVLDNNSVRKFDTATGRGELKAASDDKTTYDCCCSGPCTCPPTCSCKQSGYCGQKKAAADLLPGGEADNKPDSKFPAQKLNEGAKHEHEHTNNDQIAREIAKDHLQEDPAYYEKQKKLEAEGKKQANSVYGNLLKNQLMFREPIAYDPEKPVFENVKNQMLKLKHRGDMMLQARYNDNIWRTQLDPEYRYQMAMRAVRGEPMPGYPGVTDRLIYTYGTDALNRIPFMKVVDHGKPLG